MNSVKISPLAADDLLTIGAYLQAESQTTYLGDRFLLSIDRTLVSIARHPETGRKRITTDRRLDQLRSIAVDRPFEKYLIFYVVQSDSILILRVLHGARDFAAIADIEISPHA